jgi:hypothetical protein
VTRSLCTARLRLDADLLVPLGPAGPAAAMARAARSGLSELGLLVTAGPGDLEDVLGEVRAADAVGAARVTAGLRVALLDPYGRTDLHPDVHRRLARLDRVVLVPEGDWATDAETVALAGLRAAADHPTRVVLTGLTGDLPRDTAAAVGWACARAGVAIGVTERGRTPSVATAVGLARAGAVLVAGSDARTPAEIGRWQHVAAVAAALDVPAPVPHPGGNRRRTPAAAESFLSAPRTEPFESQEKS